MLTDRETGWIEPTVVINGVELTFPQAMTLRVAVSSFLMFCAANREGLGFQLADSYRAHSEAIERIMRAR
jgi:hypothetical protein